MTPKVTNNFITEAERQALKLWAEKAPLNVRNQPDHLLSRPQNKNRLPTSGYRKSEFIHSDDGPAEFYTIQQRMIEQFGLGDRIPTHKRKGKVIMHYADSETPEHIDFAAHMGPGYFRTSIIVQNADEGGKLIWNGKEYDAPERSCISWDSSISHSVSRITSGTRIVFVYGWKDQ